MTAISNDIKEQVGGSAHTVVIICNGYVLRFAFMAPTKVTKDRFILK